MFICKFSGGRSIGLFNDIRDAFVYTLKLKNNTLEELPSAHVCKYLAGQLIPFLENRIRLLINHRNPVPNDGITETETPNGYPIDIVCTYNRYCIYINVIFIKISRKYIFRYCFSDATDINRTLKYLADYGGRQYKFLNARDAHRQCPDLVIRYMESKIYLF